MSGLVKAASASERRVAELIGLDDRGRAGPASSIMVEDPELTAARAEVRRLQAQLTQAEQDVERLSHLADARFGEGEKQGYDQGLTAAQTLESDRLQAVATSARAAADEFIGCLASLESLAPVVAVKALDKVLGEASDYRPMVEAAVKKQLGELKSDFVVRVEVSASDYPQVENLERLRSAVDLPELNISTVADLPRGGCRIKLKLGEIDLTLPAQWALLRAALLESAASDGRP